LYLLSRRVAGLPVPRRAPAAKRRGARWIEDCWSAARPGRRGPPASRVRSTFT